MKLRSSARVGEEERLMRWHWTELNKKAGLSLQLTSLGTLHRPVLSILNLCLLACTMRGQTRQPPRSPPTLDSVLLAFFSSGHRSASLQAEAGAIQLHWKRPSVALFSIRVFSFQGKMQKQRFTTAWFLAPSLSHWKKYIKWKRY